MTDKQEEMLDAMQDALYYFEDLTADLLERIEFLEKRVKVLSDIAGVEDLKQSRKRYVRI